MKKRFKDISSSKVVIDFSNVVYRSYYATKDDSRMINHDGMNVGFILGLVKMMNYAINMCKSNGTLPQLVICEDRKPTRKRQLYHQYHNHLTEYSSDKNWDGVDAKERIRYKGNRDKMDLDFDPLEISHQYLNCIPNETIWCEGEEADDVIASYIKNHNNDQLFVFSTDKDLWQLVDKTPNLTIVLGDGSSPNKALLEKIFSTTSYSHIPLHKSIRGDSGDNVKSLLRFQFKKNLDVYQSCDGTLEDFLRRLIEKQGEKGKDVQHFMKFLHVAIMNWELVKLKSDLKYSTKMISSIDRGRWNKLCMSFETPSLLNSPLLTIY